MKKLNFLFFALIIIFANSCNKDDNIDSLGTLSIKNLSFNEIEKWYSEKSQDLVLSIDNQEKKITSLNVQPIWSQAKNWLYMNQYPILIVPFEEDPFIPFTHYSGAKLYIYKDNSDEYTTRIIGYLIDSTMYSNDDNLSVSDFTGLFYQIDTIGRIGNVYKIDDGQLSDIAQFHKTVVDSVFGERQIVSSYRDGVVVCPGDSWLDISVNWIGYRFSSIASFFPNLGSSIWNFFGTVFNGNGNGFGSIGFNGLDPVGLGPRGINTDNADPNNWDGFYIENGLSDDVFLYNKSDFRTAINNLTSIIDCIMNNYNLTIKEATTLVFKHHLGNSLADVFLDAFVNGNNPNPENFDFNKLQQFIFYFGDTHISEATGEAVNPELIEALSCSGYYLDNIRHGKYLSNNVEFDIPNLDYYLLTKSKCPNMDENCLNSLNICVDKLKEFQDEYNLALSASDLELTVFAEDNSMCSLVLSEFDDKVWEILLPRDDGTAIVDENGNSPQGVCPGSFDFKKVGAAYTCEVGNVAFMYYGAFSATMLVGNLCIQVPSYNSTGHNISSQQAADTMSDAWENAQFLTATEFAASGHTWTQQLYKESFSENLDLSIGLAFGISGSVSLGECLGDVFGNNINYSVLCW